MTWSTKIICIDLETGEVITQANAKKNYIKVKKTVKIKLEKNVYVKYIEYGCRKSKQLKLF